MKRVNWFLFVLTMVLFMMGCSAQPDPTVVIDELYKAEQAHDIDAIVALFAEDGIIENDTGFQYKGTAMIEIYYDGLHTVDIPIEYTDIKAEGDKVTWLRKKGPNPGMDATWYEVATIENGKILHLMSVDCCPE